MGPEVKLSGKHNGMCLYMARLLSQLWNGLVAMEAKESNNSTIKVLDMTNKRTHCTCLCTRYHKCNSILTAACACFFVKHKKGIHVCEAFVKT